MKTIFGAHTKLFPLVLGMGVGHLSNKSLSSNISLLILKLYFQIVEDFCQIEPFSRFIQRDTIFIWLVFQNESDWILKEKNPFLKKHVDLHQATFRSNYYF